MSKSTADCKKFLAEFFGRNPQIITALNGEHSPEQQAMFSKVANWKRVWKMNADRKDNDHTISDGRGGEYYSTYVDGAPVNRYGEGQAKRKPSDFVTARGFECGPEMEDIIFVVLEAADGSLTLAPSFGD